MDGNRSSGAMPPPPPSHPPPNQEVPNNPNPDLKSPPAGRPINGMRNPPDLALALITPEKRLVSSFENNQNQEVRKRPFPTSPGEDDGYETDAVAAKKKQVAKCLLFQYGNAPSSSPVAMALGGMSGGGCGGGRVNVSRCLFGPPSVAETQRLTEDWENDNRQAYQDFQKRYVAVEVLDMNY